MPCTKLCLSPVKGKIKFRDFRREILVIDHERLRDRGTHHDTLVSGHGAVYERIHGTLQLKPVPQRAAELERSKILGTDPPGQRPIGGGLVLLTSSRLAFSTWVRTTFCGCSKLRRCIQGIWSAECLG